MSAEVLSLVRQIYEAALDSARWQDFVESLSEAYDGAPTGFAAQLPGFPLSGVFFVSDSFAAEYRESFVAHVLRGLPWEEARRHHFVGRFGLASEVASADEIAASDFYREWMAPQALAATGPIGHTIAVEDGKPLAGLAIFCPEGRAPFCEADLALGDQLVPHLALAYRIQAESRRHRALADALDRFPTGVMLLDARGHLLRKNRVAQQILDRGDALGERDGRLFAPNPEDDALLHEHVDAVVAAATSAPSDDAPRGESSQVLAIARRAKERPVTLLLSPLRPHGGEPTLADAVAVLYAAEPGGGALRRSGALRALYGLTEAETHLVELLCQGCSLEEAADVRGVKMNTARSQLKQVFAKTKTSRQSELVRLVLSGVASLGGP